MILLHWVFSCLFSPMRRPKGRDIGCSTLPRRPKKAKEQQKQPKPIQEVTVGKQPKNNVEDMPNPKNIVGKGNRFSSTNQPPNRGRKPSLYRQLISSCEVEGQPIPSREDFYKVVAFLLERTKTELQEINALPDTPIWVQSIIGAIFEDLNNGRITVLNALFDRLFGKATQVAEVKADIYKPRTLTKEEIGEYFDKFFKEY